MTGRRVYEKALALMNELDSRGFYHADVVDFEENAVDIISLGLADLWSTDCIVRGVKPTASGYTVSPVISLDEELPLHESTCTCLPYFLASMLIEEESPSRADHFYKLYRTSVENVRMLYARGERRQIKDVYS